MDMNFVKKCLSIVVCVCVCVCVDVPVRVDVRVDVRVCEIEGVCVVKK